MTIAWQSQLLFNPQARGPSQPPTREKQRVSIPDLPEQKHARSDSLDTKPGLSPQLPLPIPRRHSPVATKKPVAYTDPANHLPLRTSRVHLPLLCRTAPARLFFRSICCQIRLTALPFPISLLWQTSRPRPNSLSG